MNTSATWRLRVCCVLTLLPALIVGACRTPPEPTKETSPRYIDGIRQTPRTSQEIQKIVSASRARFMWCFKAEAMNSEKVSAYVFRLEIYSRGEPPIPSLMKRTVKGQMVLEQCLIEQLHRLKFEPCVGGMTLIDVTLSMDALLGRPTALTAGHTALTAE